MKLLLLMAVVDVKDYVT